MSEPVNFKHKISRQRPYGKAEPGHRVSDVMVEKDGQWVPIDPAATYGVVVNNYVRNGGDYVNKMLELAGGTYPFAELEPGQGGNTTLTPA